jgi:Cd2+/Zn2+-exporting ATPase
MTAGQKAYFVSGVCCSTEEALLRKKVDSVLGGRRYTFNALTNELVVPAGVDETALTATLGAAGFGVRNTREVRPGGTFWQRHAEALVIGISAVLALAGAAAQYQDMPGGLYRTLFLGSIVLGGWKIFRKAFGALRSISLDMNFLMSIAVIGALAIDKWAEGAAVIILFGLSLVLESYSVRRTLRAVRLLMSAAPDVTAVIRDGKESVQPSTSVLPGEIILVRPGERIALDGEVVSGHSSVNQAAITGESAPVLVQQGSIVYAGSLNERGALRVRVSSAFEDTVLARIGHLVAEAQLNKPPVQQFVDRFARVYTPAVLALAVILAVVPPLILNGPFTDWFYRSLVLLVIACPCALVISTPVTIVSAITFAARQGVLIKGGVHLETMARLRSMVFDKTGTLTSGKPRVTDVLVLNSIPREEAIRLAAAMEYHSEHHLAAAIVAEAEAGSIEYESTPVESFESIPGLGIRAMIEGRRYYLGNKRFCEVMRSCSPRVEKCLEALSAEGKTGVVFGVEGEAIAIIALRDSARGESRKAIASLRESGMEHLMLLSGDHEDVAESVAREVGITEWAAAQLPHQKLDVVKDLQKRYGAVGMVGDGINDAPALAAASVGIGMGVTGTDATLETADIVLMSDDIGKLPLLVGLSRKTMSVVKQNIALALITKAVFLALSVSGVATLWMAVLADDGAALAVIMNGLRLLAYKGE